MQDAPIRRPDLQKYYFKLLEGGHMATQKLDFKGMSCPMPIMKTAIAVKKAAAGDVFEVVCDDAGFEPDVTAWCKETGNILNSVSKSGKDITAVITKK